MVDAMKFTMMIVRKYMMIGRYCEKFNIILDFDGKSPPKNVAFFKAFDKLFNANYGTYINKVIIYRPPMIMKLLFALVGKLLTERDKDKIITIGKNEKEKFKEIICPEDMELIYGGVLPNEGQYNGQYWPPRPSRQGDVVTDEIVNTENLKVFHLVNKFEDFK